MQNDLQEYLCFLQKIDISLALYLADLESKWHRKCWELFSGLESKSGETMSIHVSVIFTLCNIIIVMIVSPQVAWMTSFVSLFLPRTKKSDRKKQTPLSGSLVLATLKTETRIHDWREQNQFSSSRVYKIRPCRIRRRRYLFFLFPFFWKRGHGEPKNSSFQVLGRERERDSTSISKIHSRIEIFTTSLASQDITLRDPFFLVWLPSRFHRRFVSKLFSCSVYFWAKEKKCSDCFHSIFLVLVNEQSLPKTLSFLTFAPLSILLASDVRNYGDAGHVWRRHYRVRVTGFLWSQYSTYCKFVFSENNKTPLYMNCTFEECSCLTRVFNINCFLFRFRK
jgi:hypothetical protein